MQSHNNRITHSISAGQYFEAIMDCMENDDAFNTRYDKWFDTAANVLQGPILGTYSDRGF